MRGEGLGNQHELTSNQTNADLSDDRDDSTEAYCSLLIFSQLVMIGQEIAVLLIN